MKVANLIFQVKVHMCYKYTYIQIYFRIRYVSKMCHSHLTMFITIFLFKSSTHSYFLLIFGKSQENKFFLFKELLSPQYYYYKQVIHITDSNNEKCTTSPVNLVLVDSLDLKFYVFVIVYQIQMRELSRRALIELSTTS